MLWDDHHLRKNEEGFITGIYIYKHTHTIDAPVQETDAKTSL